jgi:hypothetical protein
MDKIEKTFSGTNGILLAIVLVLICCTLAYIVFVYGGDP